MEYDKYYQTTNLFGDPYPELIAFYSKITAKGKVLDLGCGQGRDAIALARLGFEVTGIDTSTVGIQQLNATAREENLPLSGILGDIYEFDRFYEFDFILLDSMFHFGKKEREKETELLNRILQSAKLNAHITICLQDTGKKLAILHSIIDHRKDIATVAKEKLVYTFEDRASQHHSKTNYAMITLRKIL